MNERIRLLVVNANGYWEYGDHNMPSTVCFKEADLEKFAELIAQESIVDFYRRYLDICSEEDITVQVARYVKEHFGVEE